MTLIEPIDPGISERIAKHLQPDEDLLIQVASDLDGRGDFGCQWLAVTSSRALLVGDESGWRKNGGRCEDLFDGGFVEIPVEELRSARTEPLVGGGRLEIERLSQPTVTIPYSSSMAEKFSEVARGLEQLRKREQFLVNARLERTRCQKCDRLLPEKDGSCPACVSKLTVIRRIARYVRPYRWRPVLLCLAMIALAAGELVPPIITKRIVDDVLVVDAAADTAPLQERLQLLSLLVLGLLGARILVWAMEFVQGWIVTWLGPQVTADIRGHLYRRLEMLSLQFYDKRKVGALMSRATRDAGMLEEFIVDGLPFLAISGLMIVGILGLMFWMSWSLSLYVIFPMPLIIIWGLVFWKRLRRMFMKWSQAWSRMTDRTSEVLAGIRVVKAFAGEAGEIAAFAKVNAKCRQVGVRTGWVRGIFFSTISFLTALGALIVWVIGGDHVMAGDLTLGTLLAFSAYMWMVYGPMEWFGQLSSWMSRAFAGAERIFEVIDTQAEAYEDANAVALPAMQGSVRFRNVTFGYDKSKPVLREMELDVAAGEMIGLVGKSGVGKTTAINLICRFYDADYGTIEVDGIDVRNIRLEDLRSQIGLVLQEPFLFSGTVAENIGYAKPRARFAEIMEAARVANAHDFIVAKPDGYDTQVGERGNALSGGERQRVAIARAILHDPRVLILDEATSSVDVETEKQIQEAIGRLARGRTTFAIAHRLSTLRNADRLVVMEDGHIVEIGSHRELMARRGRFYELVQEQHRSAQIIALKE